MRKVMRYECKRLLWNRFFVGLVLVLLFYGWQVLGGTTILGVAHTAPFSPWSFGDYLSRMTPLLWVGVLFFLTFFTSPKARRVASLTDAALLAIICLAQAAVFYWRYFGWCGWGELLLPAVLTLLPALIFALGSGWLLGRWRPWALYVWMLVPFVCMVLPLPEALGIWNGQFFSRYPLTLQGLDPAFSVPLPVVLCQCVLLAAGLVLLGLAGRENKRRRGEG